jgi:GT2 family glycosyltransferase
VKASVIVINYNGLEHLETCFDALARQTARDFEVVLADNASTDGSIEFVRARHPWVRVVRNPENLGFAAGNNAAAAACRAEYLVFLNNDTAVAPNWLEELLRAADSDPQIGIATGNLRSFERPGQEIDALCDMTLFGLARARPPHPESTPPVQDVFFAPGFCLLIRRDLFDVLGGFDEAYFMILEDLDLCLRAVLRGWRIVRAERAVVYHKFGGSLPGSSPVGDCPRMPYFTSPRRRYLAERNAQRTLLKTYRWTTLLALAPRYIALWLAECGYFALRGRFDFVRAHLAAVGWNIAHLRDTLRRRAEVQRTRIVSDRALQRLMVRGSLKLALAARVIFRLSPRHADGGRGETLLVG